LPQGIGDIGAPRGAFFFLDFRCTALNRSVDGRVPKRRPHMADIVAKVFLRHNATIAETIKFEFFMMISTGLEILALASNL
jgi:hypothetical protein